MTAGPPDPWLDGRYHPDLDPAAERLLRAAGRAWHDPAEAQRLLDAAEAIAGDHPALLIARYRLAFYRHRFEAALAHAEAVLAHAARRLNVPPDWRIVRPSDADFSSDGPDLRFWMFTLQAYGYVLVRLGRAPEGLAAWRALAALDMRDQTRTRLLLASASLREAE